MLLSKPIWDQCHKTKLQQELAKLLVWEKGGPSICKHTEWHHIRNFIASPPTYKFTTPVYTRYYGGRQWHLEGSTWECVVGPSRCWPLFPCWSYLISQWKDEPIWEPAWSRNQGRREEGQSPASVIRAIFLKAILITIAFHDIFSVLQIKFLLILYFFFFLKKNRIP